jgi:hypothetical protein
MRRSLSFAPVAAGLLLLACGDAPKIKDCAPGLSFCSASGCADLQKDVGNCGVCGTACGAGQVCAAGNCAAASFVYEDTFLVNVTDVSQCTRFETFRAGLTGPFRQIHFSGSRDATGVTCATPAAATQLANALAAAVTGTANSGNTIVSCDGNSWQVCNRGNNIEFWVGSSIPCDGGNCPDTGFMVRPCFPSLGFWGGINNGGGGGLCNGPTQFMSIEFDR